MTTLTRPAPVTLAEFEEIFEAVKNWGRWGPGDERGTLNYLTPGHVRAAAALVRSGRQVTMSIPMSTVAGPDNPSPWSRRCPRRWSAGGSPSTATSAASRSGGARPSPCPPACRPGSGRAANRYG